MGYKPGGPDGEAHANCRGDHHTPVLSREECLNLPHRTIADQFRHGFPSIHMHSRVENMKFEKKMLTEPASRQFGHDRLKYHDRRDLKQSGSKELRVAARDGNYSRIKDLVRGGADVNDRGGSHGNTALHYAARFGHLNCIDTLLRLRADPNIVNDDGRTALHWAAANGN